MKYIQITLKIPTADKKKLLEQEFNESQNLSISEDEENFIDEGFTEERENSNQREKIKMIKMKAFFESI